MGQDQDSEVREQEPQLSEEDAGSPEDYHEFKSVIPWEHTNQDVFLHMMN